MGDWIRPWVPNNQTRKQMIYTDQENDWLSRPDKKKRVSNQTADGQPPQQDDPRHYTRVWGIQTTIEVDGKTYVVPVQL